MTKFALDLSSYIESTQDGVLAVVDNSIVYSNEHIRNLLGKSCGDLEDTGLTDIFLQNEYDEISGLYNGNFEDIIGRYVMRIKANNNNNYSAEVTFLTGSWEDIPAKYILVREISHRSCPEKPLYCDRDLLDNILINMDVGLWQWDVNTNEIQWSEQVAKLFGYAGNINSFNYQHFLQTIHPDDRQAVEDAVQNSLDHGHNYEIEHRVVWPDESIHWLQESGNVLYDQHGTPVRMVGMVKDVTRHKVTELALNESDGKYREFMEYAGDPIIIGDKNGRIIDANKRAEEYFGYTHNELLQMTAYEIHPEEDHANLKAALHELDENGKSLYDHLIRHKDGSISHAEVTATRINYMGEEVGVAIFRDTTARINAEEKRLSETKKQRDTLVREVHHRIKNNLQGVAGLLRQHASKKPELKDILDGIVGQIKSMAVMHGLFGRNASSDIILCELIVAICNEVGSLTGTKVTPNVCIEVLQPVQVSITEAVPIALILNELIFNAIKHNGENIDPVKVTVVFDGGTAHVNIVNLDAQLPNGFDLNKGQGLGTGLSLVRSLMPNNGCILKLESQNPGVVAELILTSPVIII